MTTLALWSPLLACVIGWLVNYGMMKQMVKDVRDRMRVIETKVNNHGDRIAFLEGAHSSKHKGAGN